MSYRNPTIIDDKSGQVLGQAITQGAQNIAQGVMQMAQKNQAAAAKKKKEDEDLNVGLVNLASQYNNDLQNAAKLTQERLAGIKKEFGISMEDIINQGYLAQKEFLKNKTTENREKVEANAARRTSINKWMVGTGALVTNAQTLAKEAASDIETNVYFPPINGDDGSAAFEMTNAFMNKKGYSYGHVAEEETDIMGKGKGITVDKLAIYKNNKVIGKYTQTDLSTILETWKKRGETGVQTVQNGAKKKFVTEGVNGATINNSVKATDATKLNAEGKPTIVPIERKTINGNIVDRQQLDPTAISNIVEEQVQIMSNIVGKSPTSEQRLYYKDFGMSKTQIAARNIAIGFNKPAQGQGVEEFDKEFLTRVEDTVLKGLNVTKEVIPGEKGEPDTVRYYNDKILGRDRKTTETSATERQRGRNYQTVVADFDSTIDNYTAPLDDPERKQTIAEKVIGGTGLGVGTVVFARNQNRALDNVSINDDGSVLLRWGPPNYGNIQERAEPFKYAAKTAMLAGEPNKMITINPNREAGTPALKVRASALAPDLNSLSFDLTNKNQLRNLIRLTTDQDATGADKLIKKYNLN